MHTNERFTVISVVDIKIFIEARYVQCASDDIYVSPLCTMWT